jgi:sulfonate transport system permease protein
MSAVPVHTTRVRTSTNIRWLMLGVLLMAAAWEIAALIVAQEFRRPDQVLPPIEHVIRDFRGLSDYWHGGLGIRATADGGPRTYPGAILALGYGAGVTGLRLLTGFAIATLAGVGAGLVIGWSPALRRFMLGPVALIAALPLLALVPLFAFWFGATTRAAIAFIAFGCGITILRSTVNAIDNVPKRYLDMSRTLGATRLRLYRRVVLPAILPELRGGMTIALTFSWSLALAAELLGVQDGLGAMMNQALEFSAIGRMVFIAGTFVALAALSVLCFTRLTARLLRWMP